MKSVFFTIVLMIVVVVPIMSAADDGRIAIIDASENTTNHPARLKQVGVKVVGRYLARCFQWPGKRIVDTVGTRNSEIYAILEHGFGILSIYQYFNNSRYKFEGKRQLSTGAFVGLPDRDCGKDSSGRTADQEAELDSAAAIEQARMISQPKASAIYFGVDFNFEGDQRTRDGMVQYFRVVARRLNNAGYLVGAYGSGDALRLLKSEKLIDFAWISASRSFLGSSDFHNSGQWDLFPNWTDTRWFQQRSQGKCTSGFVLDTNIQNGERPGKYIGFWNRTGKYQVPAAITGRVYAERRFICDGNAHLLSRPDGTLCKAALGNETLLGYANTVRIGKRANELIEVDIDDDGEFDGDTNLDYA
jgi:Rv2525c-like, glycoside hydrolase-like domain